MPLTFSAAIHGAEIHCEIGTDIALDRPVFCFSLLAAAQVISGGVLVRSVAGYTEVALPDLVAGQVHAVVLAYRNPDYSPKNRAWLPLGPYLRTKTGPLPLPPGEAGVRIGASAFRQAGHFAGLKLIPQPESWTANVGSLTLSAVISDDPAMEILDALALRLNLAPLLAATGTPLTVGRDESLPPAAYRLTIAPSGIALHSSDETGCFHAGITLMNLRETYAGELPCGVILDAPRFGWRGQHLDCARHFYSVDTILRLLDLMALLKLNRFHWHFSDDEAFRLQVTCAPEIWQKTEFRGEGCLVPGVFGGGIRAGGSYCRTDVARILAHAARLQIEVLPEIEVPAHAFALNLARLGMRDPGDNASEISIQGYSENVLNPAMDATWDVLSPLVQEVASRFPIGILHLGCDELPSDAWSGSPQVATLKRDHGLVSRDDVQGWMMSKVAALLVAQGVRPAAWEEAAKGGNGGVGHNALLFSWTGQGPGVAAARQGYDVVMCPAQNVYFDMAHSGDLADWGATWAATIALEDVVRWKPVPLGAEDVAHRIVGVEGCFWSEFTSKDSEMEPMLAPRILGLANKAWDVNDTVDGPTLRALADCYAPIFDRIRWQRHTGA